MDQEVDIYDPAYVRGVFDRVSGTYGYTNSYGYSMIGVYVSRFGSCAEFKQYLEEHGLQVQLRHHFFGCATSVHGVKAK